MQVLRRSRPLSCHKLQARKRSLSFSRFRSPAFRFLNHPVHAMYYPIAHPALPPVQMPSFICPALSKPPPVFPPYPLTCRNARPSLPFLCSSYPIHSLPS